MPRALARGDQARSRVACSGAQARPWPCLGGTASALRRRTGHGVATARAQPRKRAHGGILTCSTKASAMRMALSRGATTEFMTATEACGVVALGDSPVGEHAAKWLPRRVGRPRIPRCVRSSNRVRSFSGFLDARLSANCVFTSVAVCRCQVAAASRLLPPGVRLRRHHDSSSGFLASDESCRAQPKAGGRGGSRVVRSPSRHIVNWTWDASLTARLPR